MLYTPPTTDSGSSSIRLSVKISIGGIRYFGDKTIKVNATIQDNTKTIFLIFWQTIENIKIPIKATNKIKLIHKAIK